MKNHRDQYDKMKPSSMSAHFLWTRQGPEWLSTFQIKLIMLYGSYDATTIHNRMH